MDCMTYGHIFSDASDSEVIFAKCWKCLQEKRVFFSVGKISNLLRYMVTFKYELATVI